VAYIDPKSIPLLSRVKQWFSPYISQSDMDDWRSGALSMARQLLNQIYEKTTSLITNVISFAIGFAIMILAFYYFLAEGPAIAEEIQGLLPFEPADEDAIVRQFETICRGVVLGTLVAALVQAVLLGIVLAFLQIPAAWLLTCLTALTAMIPFVGAAGTYVPVALYLLWNERVPAALLLFSYGAVIVSTADNLIRAHMIHGTARLHPLMALVSALGAVQLVGLFGIFIGPVVAGVFYALLKLVRQKLLGVVSSATTIPEGIVTPPFNLVSHSSE
jgi:predicted PurR-regulated permease PerM